EHDPRYCFLSATSSYSNSDFVLNFGFILGMNVFTLCRSCNRETMSSPDEA
ncbi:hypothetical protein KIN20_000249, partial [Parelaphostrongylus tenuis]